MSDQETAMTDAELEAFLGGQETGVLALAADDTPYAIPVSYGFDPDRGIFLRLVATEESEKRAFVGDERSARLVVYSTVPDGYESAIVDGHLVEIPRSALTVADIEHYGGTQRPLFEMWGAGESDLSVDLFRLEPTTVSGRRVHLERSLEG